MKRKNYKVYMHTCKINGKRYVGVTCRNVNERWRNGTGYKGQAFYNAIMKYGWDNFEHTIILDNLTREEAETWEIALIAQNKSNKPKYGYNIDIGGNHKGKTQKSTRMKLIHCSTREVVQLDMEYNIINKYFSIGEASRKTGVNRNSIGNCARGVYMQAGGYIWRFKGEEHKRSRQREREIKIYQYSLNGDFLCEYNGYSEASNNCNVTSTTIRNAAIGKTKMAGGFLWRIATDEVQYKLEPYDVKCRYKRKGNSKKVEKYTKDGKYLKTYDNAIDAEKQTGIPKTYILEFCRGRRANVREFIWKYEGNRNDNCS